MRRPGSREAESFTADVWQLRGSGARVLPPPIRGALLWLGGDHFGSSTCSGRSTGGALVFHSRVDKCIEREIGRKEPEETRQSPS
jgi:hypothetical protein